MYYNNNTMAFLDGKFIRAAEANGSLLGQSLHYGYAVFEGIRAYSTTSGSRIFKAKEHYERLQYSAQAIGLPFTYTTEELEEISYRLLALNGLSDAYIRPLVFVAAPFMGLTAPAESSLYMAAWPWEKLLGNELLRLQVSPYQRPNPKAVPIEAKVSGHYANSIMASTYAKKAGFHEALLLDGEGFVAEGPGANFFFEQDGALYTAPAGSILQGITRATIIALAREAGIAVHEQLFAPEALRESDGAFMTGTAAEVVGVQSVNERTFRKPYAETIGAFLAERYSLLVRGRQEVWV